MYSVRKKIYADDLLIKITNFKRKIKMINKKLGNDILINQGLFVMACAIFEDSVRGIMEIVLKSFPEKLKLKTCNITKKQVCEIADLGHGVIIDNELFALFRDGVGEQLRYLLEIICNIKKNDYTEELNTIIKKCVDISYFRNSLIHNGGKASETLLDKALIYKMDNGGEIVFDKILIKKFTKDYIELFIFLESRIKETFEFYQHRTRIGKLQDLWEEVFESPLLRFEEYWILDTERDLITDMRFPEYEESISSSEKVLLSIWRHQFDDAIKTQEFLLCSVNYKKICKIYKGLSNLQFNHMFQQANNDI